MRIGPYSRALLEHRLAARLLQARPADRGLRRREVEHDEFRRHGNEGKEKEDAHRGHEPLRRHEVGGQRGGEDGEQARDRHPGIDADEFTAVGVLDEQAGPGIVRDLPGPVEKGRDEKVVVVLRDHPDRHGQRPGHDVEDEGRAPATEAVGHDAAEEGREDLHHHADGQQGADADVVDAQGEHVDGEIGRVEGEGNAPERLGIDTGPRVAAQCQEGVHQAVLPDRLQSPSPASAARRAFVS